ncbi:MAG: methyl-accepting chemotaxis protein [Spirochaetes bacterium]|nr:methyl-accepting chemotaxis protein [Spirochaetota bacterium]
MNEYILFACILVSVFFLLTGVSYGLYRWKIITKLFIIFVISVAFITYLGFILGKMGMTFKVSLITIPIGLVTGVVAVLFINSLIVRPIKDMQKAISRISNGDLNVDINLTSRDEFGEISDQLKTMARKLSQMIGTMADLSRYLVDASQQIRNASQSLSASSSEQSANIEEISSSLEEILANVTENARKSLDARTVTDDSSRKAVDGGKQIEDAILSISDISKDTEKVTEIVDFINSIAFQTNLLALNAAVEAARAGEHGRGFAVVAAEVRNLAQRTSQSSKEISDLIANSLGTIRQGENLSANSIGSMRGIIDSSKTIVQLVEEMALSNTEIEQGVRQISSSMNGLGEISQKNASSSEEMAGTADSLANLVKNLNDIM